MITNYQTTSAKSFLLTGGSVRRGVFAKSKWEISGAMTVREMVLRLPVLAHVLQRISDFLIFHIAADRNIEIIWGICTLQSARNNIRFVFPRTGKYKEKKRIQEPET